jgi:hypothetical protein
VMFLSCDVYLVMFFSCDILSCDAAYSPGPLYTFLRYRMVPGEYTASQDKISQDGMKNTYEI